MSFGSLRVLSPPLSKTRDSFVLRKKIPHVSQKLLGLSASAEAFIKASCIVLQTTYFTRGSDLKD